MKFHQFGQFWRQNCNWFWDLNHINCLPLIQIAKLLVFLVQNPKDKSFMTQNSKNYNQINNYKETFKTNVTFQPILIAKRFYFAFYKPWFKSSLDLRAILLLTKVALKSRLECIREILNVLYFLRKIRPHFKIQLFCNYILLYL